MLQTMVRSKPTSTGDHADTLDARRLLIVSAWGAATTVLAWLVSGGSILWFIVAIVVIGVSQRLVARYVWLRSGQPLPRWWWK